MPTYMLKATSSSSEAVMMQYGANGRVEYLAEAEAQARGAEWVAMLNREADPKDWSLTIEQSK